MKPSLRSGLFVLWLVVLACKVDDLPREKSLKTCQKPVATITATADPTDFRKYTLTLSGVTGEVTQVVWTANGQTQTVAVGQSLTVNFPQASSYPVTASLQNVCNNNTTVQTTVTVAPGAPVVTTGQPVGVGSASATVEMTVVSLGGNPSLSEYGIVYAQAPSTNPILGFGIAKSFPGTPTINSPVSVTITGLTPGTTYYYRAYVKNPDGTVTYASTVSQFTTTQPALNTWSRVFGGSSGDQGFFVLPLPAGGAMFVGNSNSNNSGDFQNSLRGVYDAWVGRVDGNGTLLNQWNYGGNGNDNLYTIQATRDGNYILCGTTNSTNFGLTNRGGLDAWVIKIRPDGTELWSRTYGGSGDDIAFAVQPTEDGGYIFAGRSTSSDGQLAGQGQRGNTDAWVVKINGEGVISWQKLVGGTGYDAAGNLVATSDGGCVMVGQTASSDGDMAGKTRFGGGDMWAVKVNSGGGVGWVQPLGGSGDDIATTVQQVSDGGFIVAGNFGTASASTDGRVYRLGAAGNPIGGGQSFGGPGKDEIAHIEAFNDGSFLLTGNTESTNIPGYKGAMDAWVIKLDAGYSVTWQKAFGGTGIDQGYCIRPTTDGGYVMGGITNSNNGDVSGHKGGNDVFLIKMNTAGTY